MNITLSTLCIPLFSQTLAALSANLEKAEAYATARGFDPKLLLDTRLFPDMYPLSQQIRIACDFAKSTSARSPTSGHASTRRSRSSPRSIRTTSTAPSAERSN